MVFSRKIKEDILVASARHCCVCHRYKGVKVEVHHIVPKEQGGEDILENAIALCFDCHSDAGHYFAKHPKGTKFTVAELRKHKSSWFKIVAENRIPIKKNNLIHARYLITKEFDVIKNICEKDLSDFPIKNCLLLDTPVLSNCQKLFKKQTYRDEEVKNLLTIGPEEYSKKYPTASVFKNNDEEYRFYYHERIPNEIDIINNCKKDNISKHLMQNGVSPAKIAKILTCYEGECEGGGAFQELYQLRPAYYKYLILSNISGNYIKFDSLDVLKHSDVLFTEQVFDNEDEITFPPILIEPNQSVVIPLGMFLANFNDLEKSQEYTIIHEIHGDRSQVLDHGAINNESGIEYFGENYLPKKVMFSLDGQTHFQDIHDFNFDNLYWIDGYWNCGSCPHLFFETNTSQIKYQGEIFSSLLGKISSEEFKIKKDIKNIIITELEQETTIIEYIKINGIKRISKVKLYTGQKIKLPVRKNDTVEIRGYYLTNSDVYRTLPFTQKETIIRKFKNNYA